MKEVIVALFGSYSLTFDPNTGNVVCGLAGLDWPWLAGVALFGLTLYCVLRLIGGVIPK